MDKITTNYYYNSIVLHECCEALNRLGMLIHSCNIQAGWWSDANGNPIECSGVNVVVKLALIHSEISEALEGHRKNLMDDKLPARKMIEVELADAVIRILDLAEGMGLDIAGALQDKVKYNSTREDHSLDHRSKEKGKKY